MVNLGNFVKTDFTSLFIKGSTVKGKNLLPSVKEKNLLSVGANSFLYSRHLSEGNCCARKQKQSRKRCLSLRK